MYSEEEYMNGGRSSRASMSGRRRSRRRARWHPQANRPRRHRLESRQAIMRAIGLSEPRGELVRVRRLRRAAGVAMLAGAVGAVGGVVVMNVPWAQRSVARRQGHLVAATRSPVARPPVSKVLDSQPTPARPVIVRAHARHTRACLTGGAQLWRPRPPVHCRSSNHSLPRVPARPRGGVAVAVDYVPRSSSAPRRRVAGEWRNNDCRDR